MRVHHPSYTTCLLYNIRESQKILFVKQSNLYKSKFLKLVIIYRGRVNMDKILVLNFLNLTNDRAWVNALALIIVGDRGAYGLLC